MTDIGEEYAKALFSLTALDTSRMTDISLEDGAGSVNVAQITLCLPTDDDAETDNDGQISERTGGMSKNDADSSNDGAPPDPAGGAADKSADDAANEP